jgi:cytochrome c5
MRNTLRLAFAALILMVAIFDRHPTAAQPKPAAAANDTAAHTITLPQMEPNLPPAPGRETVLATCVICHTTRYITMQPTFTRAAWTAEVEKMRKVFGAPMTNEQAAQAVDYLVAIRGAAEPAKQ